MAAKGRPTAYSPELGEKICQELAEGMSLKRACLKHKCKHPTVLSWLLDNRFPEFSDKYARAREIQYYGYADDIIEDAENDSLDRGKTVIEEKVGTGKKAYKKTITKFVNDPVAVQRDRLRVDAKKWVLSKLLPKKFGDKVEAPKEQKEFKPHEATEVIINAEPMPQRYKLES